MKFDNCGILPVLTCVRSGQFTLGFRRWVIKTRVTPQVKTLKKIVAYNLL